jgi:dephospho-CoA kinase
MSLMSTVPLQHRVVALTGPLAGGKTTIRDILLDLLTRLGHPTQMIHNVFDLYAPVAAHMGLPLSRDMPRDDITAVITHIFAKRGRGVGAWLLLDFLNNRSTEPIYIIDSKRSPESIRLLKRGVSRSLIIGVTAPLAVRRARMLGRQKPMDIAEDGTVDSSALERETANFDIDGALALADVIIENDCALPFRTEMLLLEALVQAQLIPRFSSPYKPVPPLRKAESPKGIPSLTRRDYRRALDDFAALTEDYNVVVVQGGNRFAVHYLRTQHGRGVAEIKFSSLSKQHPSLLLETMLTPHERVREFRGLSASDVMRALPHPYIPFTRRTNNDRRVQRNFAELQALIAAPQPLVPAEERAREVLRDTAIFQHLATEDRPVAFLDDMLYRGRTLHVAWYMLRLFGLLDKQWRFFAVCLDRASQDLRSPYVHILRPGFGYPFENCARSAQGYYDLTAGRFEYRDLSQIRSVLAALWSDVEQRRNPLDVEWQRLLSRTAMILRPGRRMEKIARNIAEIAVHCQTFGGDSVLSPNALADQRAIGLGWCPAFLSFWDNFISQEWPVGQRERFKNRIRTMVLRAQDSVDKNVFQDLLDVYADIYPRVWYSNDCLV